MLCRDVILGKMERIGSIFLVDGSWYMISDVFFRGVSVLLFLLIVFICCEIDDVNINDRNSKIIFCFYLFL